MSGRCTRKTQQAWTMIELMIVLAVFSIIGLVLLSLFTFGLRSFAALGNYAALDQANRQAMDKLTSEIRQARQIIDFATNPPTLSLINGNGATVVYTFNPHSQQMVRDVSDGTHEVLLANCNLLNFHLYKRNPSNANYGIFPAADSDWQRTVKVIELSWKSSMTIAPTTRVTSENIQTARIVIRKAQTID